MNWWKRFGPALTCVLAVPLAFALCKPLMEIGIGDDWSYIHMSKVAAETGGLHYDGWIQAMVGPLAFWGAAVIKLFGFSFSAVRASMIPFAIGCAFLMYSLARWTGVGAWPAATASLSLTLCPLIVPLEATFMSDIPALFLFLLAVYCMLRASTSDSPGAIYWLAAATLAGYTSGTIRQVMWGAPILMLGAFIFLRRKDRTRAIAAGVMLLAVIVCIVATVYWFNAQPLTRHESGTIALTSKGIHLIAKNFVFSILTIGAFCLPVSVRLLGVRAGSRAILLRAACAFAVICLSLWHKVIRAPWFTNIVTMNGILRDNEINVGNRPFLIIGPPRYVLGACVIAVSVFAVLTAVACYERWQPTLESRFGLFCCMTVPFSAASLAIVVLRSSNSFVTDRYLVPALAIALICVVAVSDRIPSIRPGLLSWVTLLIVGTYAITITHDFLREHEAIAEVTSRLTQRGIPRECIMGGYEYDGWTQIEDTGQAVPPEELGPRHLPVEYYFLRSANVVKPKYYSVLSKQAALSQALIDDQTYYAWFPRGPRHLLVQEDPASSCPAITSNSPR